MLEKDLEDIAELEAANEELEAYRERLAGFPAAPASDAALALLAEDDDEPESASGPFRDGAVAARKAALLARNKSLRVAVDAREPVVVVAPPVPIQHTRLPAWMKPSLPMVLIAGVAFVMIVPFLLQHCLSD